MADLPSSKLGTKEHWDSVYAREIHTFQDIGEEGEVWFGEDAVETMVAWCLEHCEARGGLRVLDVGCGNGHLLFALLEEDYDANSMLGVDYSPSSVKLSEEIAASKAKQGLQGSDAIRWQVVDILDPAQVAALGQFDLILDKGTFDAISLAEKTVDGAAPNSLYAPAIKRLLKPKGLFCITSCNWTEEELVSRFTHTDAAESFATDLQRHSAVPKPTFMFGGQTGQTTCTVAFTRSDV